MSSLLSAEMKGGPELQALFRMVSREVREDVKAEVEQTGQEVRSEIVLKYHRGPATGRTYKLSYPKRTHRASRAGEYPMSDTGALARRTLYRSVSTLAVEVYNTSVYAAPLEYGTRDGKLKPRPAWRDTLDEMAEPFYSRLQKILDEGMTR